jgi:mono/diheme cytochrome c family protein
MLGGLLLAGLTWPACGNADRNLPPEYRDLTVPPGLMASRDAEARGRRLFVEHCALCHGTNGDGHGERSEGLSGRPRDFTNADWRRSSSPRHVYFAIREGLPGTSMPQWKSLSIGDAWDLTAYVLSIGGGK